MEVKASSVYDAEAIRALVRLRLCHGRNPVRWLVLWMTFIAVFLGIALWDVSHYGPDPLLIFCIVVFVVCACYFLFEFFLLPMLRLRAHGAIAGVKNEFLFGADSVKIRSVGEGVNAEAELDYSSIWRSYETSRYIFIYQNRVSAFIVDRRSLTPFQTAEVRRLLASGGKKYVRCKY